MTEPLDVFAVIGKENYNWVGQAQTYDEAAFLIRKYAKDGTFFVHSQTTFFTTSNLRSSNYLANHGISLSA